MEAFQDMGWMVNSAQAANRGKTQQHSRHMLRLRHKDYLDGFRVDGIIPELIILNSHNGSWALRMMLGMFRMVCTNGMVAGSVWEGVTLKHYRLKEVENKIQMVTAQLSDHVHRLGSTIDQWDSIEMRPEQSLELAKTAIQIRWGDATPIEPATLLEARRNDDMGTSLWKTFNRVQENLTQGGFSGRATNNRAMQIKGIKNVKRDFLYNRKLWDAANSYSIIEAA
jgi:hypothetical protein